MTITKLLRISAIALSALFVMPVASAHNTARPADEQTGRTRQSREEMAAKLARSIAADLSLDTEKSERFVDVYVAQQREIWKRLPPPQTHRHGRHDARNTEATDSAMQRRFENEQTMLDIRRKYYKEYAKFLTPAQIDRFYSLERAAMRRLSKRR